MKVAIVQQASVTALDEGVQGMLEALKERGYVVIGWKLGGILEPLKYGEKLYSFANKDIPGHCLMVGAKTDKRDWRIQGEMLFGKPWKDPSKRHRKDQFYRCALNKLPNWTINNRRGSSHDPRSIQEKDRA